MAVPKSVDSVKNVAALIDNRPISGLQFLIIAICFGIMAVDGFDTYIISYIASSIQKEWVVKPEDMKAILSSGLLGLMVGAFIFGLLSDRLGRKVVLIISMAFFGVTTIFSALSSSSSELTVLRFLTGLGLGGAMPAALTLTSEYCPNRRRSSLVMIMFCGFTLGSSLGGIASAYLIEVFGWRSVLWCGGVLPLLMLPITIRFLPESVRYLALKQEKPEAVRRLMQRIAPKEDFSGVKFVVMETEQGKAMSTLFRRSLLKGTLLLWLGFFMSLMSMFLFANWLPMLLDMMGMSLKEASLIAMMFTFGGTVGAVILGVLMDKLSQAKVLCLSFSCAAGFIALLGRLPALPWLFALMVFLAGICLSGSQVGINALATSFYPVDCRGIGVSWANSVGRSGAVMGSMIGGWMLVMEFDHSTIFLLTGMPALMTGGAMFLLSRQDSFAMQRQPSATAISSG